MNSVSSLVAKCIGLPIFYFFGRAIVPVITVGRIKVDDKDHGIERARHRRDLFYWRDGQLYIGANTAQLIAVLLAFLLLIIL